MITKECRCCGARLEYPEGLEVYLCPSCGTENERPKVEGIMLDNFCRAIRQQLNRDFCDAEMSYQFVLNSRPDNAEALWGRLMCHYGAVFINENGRRRYEIHFPRRKPIREQGDFLRACELAVPAVRAQYEEDAAYIDHANARILALAENKQPYDVFLCHKTTLSDGRGYTEDYNRAFQLYNLLTKKGFRVFFAPVEMPESAAGEDYEATIYHALDTARVMLVICSSREQLQSTWVQSEWSRYLEKIDDGQNKLLIPLLYGGMKAAQLPEPFHHRSLQAITMELGGEKALMKVMDRQVKVHKGGLKPMVMALIAAALIAVGAGAAWLAGQGSIFGGTAVPTATPGRTSMEAPVVPQTAEPIETPAPASATTAAPTTTTCPHSQKSWQWGSPSCAPYSDREHTLTQVEYLICGACGAVEDSAPLTMREAHDFSAGVCVKCGFEAVPTPTPSPTPTATPTFTPAPSPTPTQEPQAEVLTASARGLESFVTVTVTLDADGAIATLAVDCSGETPVFADLCTDDAFLGQFIGKQGPFVRGVNVDGITGATWTSNAVIEALNSLFPVTSTAQGILSDVGVTVAFTADGAIAALAADLGQEVMGKELITDDFLRQFIGKKGPFEGVEVVTGATYTSNAVINAVNSLFAEATAGDALTAAAPGFGGADVGVTVTLNEDGTIATLDIDVSKQVPPVCNLVLTDDFKGQFIGKQGPFENVEVVTGATYTSDGIVMALNSLFTGNEAEEKPLIYQSVVDALTFETVDIPMMVRITKDEVFARSGPGNEYAASACVVSDQRFTVYAEKKDRNGKKWYRICVEGVYCWIPEQSCVHSLEIVIEE